MGQREKEREVENEMGRETEREREKRKRTGGIKEKGSWERKSALLTSLMYLCKIIAKVDKTTVNGFTSARGTHVRITQSDWLEPCKQNLSKNRQVLSSRANCSSVSTIWALEKRTKSY